MGGSSVGRVLLPLLLKLLVSPQCADAGYADLSMLDSTIAHGMIIDAGSSGSRMHVYEWEPRMFKRLPPPISIPGSTNQWTHRMEPGLSSFSNHLEDIPKALGPLVDFAKDILKDHEKDWQKFPIYLKATAGMRELSYKDREAILRVVREYLGNPETCPFFFAFDQARVISGEEEGIYGWAAVNFLRGELLEASAGAGTANPEAMLTQGTLDLGGGSAQISFFKRDQDILANLFKLQIGAQKHWNVYTHSFLQFGLNSARKRMHSKVVNAALAYRNASSSTQDQEGSFASGPDPVVVVDACLPRGFNETFLSPRDGKEYLIVPADSGADFDACDKQTSQLLERETSSTRFCQFAFPGQCSLLGTYQPDLPKGDGFGRFYGFSGYYKLWQFLDLPEATSVESIVGEGHRICSMSRDELAAYNEGRDKHESNAKYLNRYCFMSSYITTLLRDGFGFPSVEEITFVDNVGGYKVDWALGSMLYEINALPWSYIGTDAPPAVDCPDSAKEETQAAAGDSQKLASSGHGSAAAWTSVAAGMVAIAALAWGFMERRKRLRGTRDVEREASPWRVSTAGGGGRQAETRRVSSQYESISDVSPRV